MRWAAWIRKRSTAIPACSRAVTAAPIAVDQYGIRTRLDVAGLSVKFEIIREGRIDLEPPGRLDRVLGIATATTADLTAMKLLANSDRWADPTVFCRDVLDLAMIAPRRPILARAARKAIDAYGLDVVRDAHLAVGALLADPRRLQRCQNALAMHQPRAEVANRLRRLAIGLRGVAPAS